MWGNIVSIHNVFFQEKNYKAKLSTSSIWKKKTKTNKDNSEKKTKKKEKSHMEKHCSNQQCFKEKTTKLNFQPAQY